MIPRSDGSDVIDEQRADPGDAREELADLLSDPHCRYLLQYLSEHDGPASVSTVTRYVVAEITDSSPEAVDDDVQRRVDTWFHHGQLPVLDAHGVVDFDPEADTVRLAENPLD